MIPGIVSGRHSINSLEVPFHELLGDFSMSIWQAIVCKRFEMALLGCLYKISWKASSRVIKLVLIKHLSRLRVVPPEMIFQELPDGC